MKQLEPLERVARAMDEYEKGAVLGEGTFGKVVKGVHKQVGDRRRGWGGGEGKGGSFRVPGGRCLGVDGRNSGD